MKSKPEAYMWTFLHTSTHGDRKTMSVPSLFGPEWEEEAVREMLLRFPGDILKIKKCEPLYAVDTFEPEPEGYTGGRSSLATEVLRVLAVGHRVDIDGDVREVVVNGKNVLV